MKSSGGHVITWCGALFQRPKPFDLKPPGNRWRTTQTTYSLISSNWSSNESHCHNKLPRLQQPEEPPPMRGLRSDDTGIEQLECCQLSRDDGNCSLFYTLSTSPSVLSCFWEVLFLHLFTAFQTSLVHKAVYSHEWYHLGWKYSSRVYRRCTAVWRID